MSFDATEKERIRYHLGYTNAQPAASIQLGIPRPIQTMFLVESAMDLLIAETEDRVRSIVKIMDNIECKMVEGQSYLVANRLDTLEIRSDNIDALEMEYYRWACRLADNLGVPLYPYCERFIRARGNTGAGNIPVRR
jgi:hypothetical protein